MERRNLRLTTRHRLRFTEADASAVMPGNGNQSNALALSRQNFMKKSMLLLVALFIFTSVVLKAQSPQKINFQSIVRNTSGVIVSNKSVKFKITILADSTTGIPVYSETHLKTTDAIGLVSLQIGSGTVTSGVFSSLNWGNASHFIKLEADFTGGNTYVPLGTQELMSVPYAMYAAKTDTASLNLTNRFAEKAPVNNPTFTGTVGGITKTMVDGLENVNNTSDEDKPVSSLTQTALALKAPVNNPSFTGTVGGITKAMVDGLENVENTTDLSKPVSSLTQSAINTKVNISDTMTMLANYKAAIDTKLNKSDFPRGNSLGEFLYWNGDRWTSLEPGQPGQSIILDQNRNPTWGCIIPNSAATPSTIPTLTVNTRMTDITIATTGVTDIDVIYLPQGLQASWSANVITISGIPELAGSFQYEFFLRVSCGEPLFVQGRIEVTPAPPACPTPTVEDIDGNIYSTVSIGNQCWTKENLRVSRYNDGTLISVVTDNTEWSNPLRGIRSWYNNDSLANEIPYGNLYNWYAVQGRDVSLSLDLPKPYIFKNICPDGWHVPTDAEWTILTQTLGVDVAGAKMKSMGTNYWSSESAGTDNSSGFSALPGGLREPNGSFYDIGTNANFWSATENGDSAWYRFLTTNLGYVTGVNQFKANGMSVRCLLSND